MGSMNRVDGAALAAWAIAQKEQARKAACFDSLVNALDKLTDYAALRSDWPNIEQAPESHPVRVAMRVLREVRP